MNRPTGITQRVVELRVIWIGIVLGLGDSDANANGNDDDNHGGQDYPNSLAPEPWIPPGLSRLNLANAMVVAIAVANIKLLVVWPCAG